MADTPYSIRKAELRDAEAIMDCHRAAIFAKASGFYEPRILEVWGVITDTIIQKVRKEIAEAGTIYYVAEHPADGIIGFGIVISGNNELRAVYVRPNPYGRIGKGILDALMQEAQKVGCQFLEADGSINAEEFYVRNGFRILSRGIHRMSAGEEMACIKMRVDF